MRSFAIVIRRAYFEAKKRMKYAKNVVVNRSAFHQDLHCLLKYSNFRETNTIFFRKCNL